MEKLKIWFRNYLRKNSTLKIIGDVVFYVFIILMIIPTTRRDLSAVLIKATLRKPHVKTEISQKVLTSDDYRLLFKDLNGEEYSLADFKDKVILLNFWATWCPPCRAEMPALQDLYADYGNKISFILVSSEEPDKLRQFLGESGFDFPVYMQQSPLPQSFPVQSIPTTFIISNDGKIVVDKTGAANWNSEKFRHQLDELIAQ